MREKCVKTNALHPTSLRHNNQNIIFSACFVSNFSGSNRCRYISKRFTFIWKLENQNFPGIQQVLLWLSRCSAKYFSYVFSWIGCPTYVELIWITFDRTEVRRLNRAKRRAKRMRFQFFVAVQCTRALVLNEWMSHEAISHDSMSQQVGSTVFHITLKCTRKKQLDIEYQVLFLLLLGQWMTTKADQTTKTG